MKYNIKLKWAIPVMAMSAQMLGTGCNNMGNNTNNTKTDTTAKVSGYDPNFKVEAQSFADLQVLRYEIPGFDGLSLQQKKLSYYLYEAALCGRDIIYDQKSKYGLLLRKTIEGMYGTYDAKKDATPDNWKKFEEYCGRVWFSNGNHHHYSNIKSIM